MPASKPSVNDNTTLLWPGLLKRKFIPSEVDDSDQCEFQGFASWLNTRKEVVNFLMDPRLASACIQQMQWTDSCMSTLEDHLVNDSVCPNCNNGHQVGCN